MNKYEGLIKYLEDKKDHINSSDYNLDEYTKEQQIEEIDKNIENLKNMQKNKSIKENKPNKSNYRKFRYKGYFNDDDRVYDSEELVIDTMINTIDSSGRKLSDTEVKRLAKRNIIFRIKIRYGYPMSAGIEIDMSKLKEI